MRSLILLVVAIAAALTLAASSPALAQMGDGSMASDNFDSGVLRNGDAFSHAFNDTGTFGYHCHIHSSMTGTVTVTGAQPPPTQPPATPPPAPMRK